MPTVTACGQTSVAVVESARRQERRSLLPPVVCHERSQLAPHAGICRQPRPHLLGDFVHAGHIAAGIDEIGNQGCVQHMPILLPFNLGDRMPAQLSSASVQSRRPSQRLNVGRRTTALAVAINVERLDRVVHAEIFMQEFFRRHVLMSKLHHAVPHGHGFLAVGHVGLEKRCLPSLEIGNVVDAPRQDLDVGNDTDFFLGTCRFLAKNCLRAKPPQTGN